MKEDRGGSALSALLILGIVVLVLVAIGYFGVLAVYGPIL